MHPAELLAVQILGTVLSLAQYRMLFPVHIQAGEFKTKVRTVMDD